VGVLQYEARLYRAQRNLLLCSTSVGIVAIIARLMLLLKEVGQLTANKEALAKQSAGAAAAYKAMSEECDALKKLAGDGKGGDDGGSAGTATDAEDELATARATIQTLRERSSKLLDERDAATASAEAMKKQAAGLSQEYARLLAQKESLENKLADYELVFGEGGDMKKKL